MSKRECCDCRENEKTFRNNFHYKCVNDNCENYITPVEFVDFQKDMINQLIDKLNEKHNENLRLKKEIKRLLIKLSMCDITF